MIPPYQVTLDYTFHWRPVFNKFPNLLEAGLETLKVAVIAMIFGIIIGLILNYLKQSKWFIYRWFSISWIEIARNTPALLQLFFFGLHTIECRRSCIFDKRARSNLYLPTFFVHSLIFSQTRPIQCTFSVRISWF